MLKILILIIILVIIALGVFLLYASISDYRPEEQTILFETKESDMLSDSSEISMLIWNIGYGGLNAESDFFYDGGKSVYPEKETVINNVNEIKKVLSQFENNDFILLQEVDQNSRRSHKINQYDTIAQMFENRHLTFGKNYDVFFVPQPVSKPMGKVVSGLMTISKYTPSEVIRFSFPGNYSWPVGLFFLDRCFIVNKYPLSNTKELLIINTHNSAYDDGSLRKQQMEYLSNFLTAEYKKGNYIIVAGDWNQCPPNFKPDFTNNLMDNSDRTDIPSEYLKSWTWAYDNTLPTNRRVSAPYNAKNTLTTVIDFFLLSPNIQKISVKNINLDFKNSDHNPVKLNIKLK